MSAEKDLYSRTNRHYLPFSSNAEQFSFFTEDMKNGPSLSPKNGDHKNARLSRGANNRRTARVSRMCARVAWPELNSTLGAQSPRLAGFASRVHNAAGCRSEILAHSLRRWMPLRARACGTSFVCIIRARRSFHFFSLLYFQSDGTGRRDLTRNFFFFACHERTGKRLNRARLFLVTDTHLCISWMRVWRWWWKFFRESFRSLRSPRTICNDKQFLFLQTCSVFI